MFAAFRLPRNPVRALLALLTFAVLAACDPIPMGGGGPRIDTSEPVPVALLVPRGSAQAGDEVLAQNLENAARLAISDLAGAQIDLRVYATGGSAAQAAQAATQAVDDGAKIILGPVFAEASNAAAVAVRSRGVNVLSFSNNADIAGGNVFVLGQTFQNTADRLVRYAAGQGKGRILIVSERTPGGETGQRAIERAVAGSSATLAGSQSFDYSQQGIVDAIPSIRGALQSSGASSMFLTADTAGALPLLAQLLPEAGIDPASTQYIGLTRWDIPPATMSLPGIQGGWFALPDPALNTQFQNRYAAAYGSQPHPIAGLAYDGIAAIGALVQSGNSAALTGSGLTQPSGFVGVNGIFRFRPDGTNERGLAVAQIRNNQVYVIDPAPRSFGAGF